MLKLHHRLLLATVTVFACIICLKQVGNQQNLWKLSTLISGSNIFDTRKLLLVEHGAVDARYKIGIFGSANAYGKTLADRHEAYPYLLSYNVDNRADFR